MKIRDFAEYASFRLVNWDCIGQLSKSTFKVDSKHNHSLTSQTQIASDSNDKKDLELG